MTNLYLAFCVTVSVSRSRRGNADSTRYEMCVCVHVETYILDGHLTWTKLTHRFSACSKEETIRLRILHMNYSVCALHVHVQRHVQHISKCNHTEKYMRVHTGGTSQTAPLVNAAGTLKVSVTPVSRSHRRYLRAYRAAA